MLCRQSLYSMMARRKVMISEQIKGIVPEGNLKENNRVQKGLYLAKKGHVRRIKPSTTTATLWKVKSESSDILYSVVQRADGTTTCDCKDFANRGHIETCKHIWAVVYSEISMEEVKKK